MPTRREFLAATLAGLAAGPSAWAATRRPPASAPPLVLRGGPIYTGVPARPRVDLLVLRDGRVAYAGGADAPRALTRGARVLDLHGSAAFPGFVDAHAHLTGIGLRELTLNLEGTASVADLVERLREFAARQPAGPIVGRGWIETHWPERRFPTRADLDAAVSGRAVFLERADGHAAVVNSAALALGGVTAATADPPGGEVLRDADGAPTGMLIDRAMGLVEAKLPAPDATLKRTALERGARLYAARGWTGLHNMSVAAEDLALLRPLARDGRIGIRVENYMDPSGADEVLERGPYDADGRVRVRGLKIYADGALGSRGAALLAPYADAPRSTGLLLLQREEALGWMQRARRVGAQVATHAIGDLGNRLTLDWIEAALAGDAADRRWRIEHAQVIAKPDLPRFAQLRVIASMQPSHAIGDLWFAPDRLGPNRLGGAYAWRSLLDTGAVIAAGSDAPVEKGDPLVEFYAAVHRHSLDGRAGSGWHLEQAVTRAEALRMLTWGPAYACGREAELGTLEVGKRADVSVFDRDLMTVAPADIPGARAVATVVDGAVLHAA